jgi:hypothetical protein
MLVEVIDPAVHGMPAIVGDLIPETVISVLVGSYGSAVIYTLA